MIQVYIVFFKIFVFLALGFVLNKTKVIDGKEKKIYDHIKVANYVKLYEDGGEDGGDDEDENPEP